MIIQRDKVRQAVARALLLDPTGGLESAVAAAASALAIPVEAVLEAVEANEEQPA